VLYLVLTFPRRGELAFGSKWDAFAGLHRAWRRLYFGMRRAWPGVRYVSTVESHRDGWPHLNVVLVSDEIAAAVRRWRRDHPSWSREGLAVSVGRELFGDSLTRAGFGRRVWLEQPRSVDRLAAYAAKLASVGSAEAAEIAKPGQVPIDAPVGFRRLRSSRGFLPAVKCRGDSEWTGRLVHAVGGQPISQGHEEWERELALLAGLGGRLDPELAHGLDLRTELVRAVTTADSELGPRSEVREPARRYQLRTRSVGA
jgi:hypothetical protein